MTLEARIKNDMIAAMKSGDTKRRDALRLVISSLKNEVVTLSHELTDAEAELVVSRMKKQLTQAADEYERLGDADRAGAERSEATIMAEYLPTPLTDDELSLLVQQEVTAAASRGDLNLGSVIQAVKQTAGNRADGARVAQLVRTAIEDAKRE